jgi:hypothetical protein
MIPVREDVDAVIASLVERNMTREQAERLYYCHFNYFRTRVRRVVPEPSVLLQRLEVVKEALKVCSADGVAFWTDDLAAEWANFEVHARNGCLRCSRP